MTPLLQLDPEFVRWEDRVDNVGDVHPVGVVRTHGWRVATLDEAQGIMFDCPAPACQAKGAHRILVAFRDRGVLDHQGSRNKDGKPSRWQVVSGTGFADLTLAPSIDCTPSDPTCWHGHIQAGVCTP